MYKHFLIDIYTSAYTLVFVYTLLGVFYTNGYLSYILKLFCLFVCLFELIEELAGARNLKIGMEPMEVSNDISTKEFEWLRKIFTPSLKKVSKCLSLHMTRLIDIH